MKLTLQNIQIGSRVKSRYNFSDVTAGTEGIIDEDYVTGIMVAWDLPEHPLPDGYQTHDGRPAFATGILRDGFDKETELHLLELVD